MNKYLKMLLIAILALALVFTFVACNDAEGEGGNGDGTGTGDGNGDGTPAVTIETEKAKIQAIEDSTDKTTIESNVTAVSGLTISLPLGTYSAEATTVEGMTAYVVTITPPANAGESYISDTVSSVTTAVTAGGYSSMGEASFYKVEGSICKVIIMGMERETGNLTLSYVVCTPAEMGLGFTAAQLAGFINSVLDVNISLSVTAPTFVYTETDNSNNVVDVEASFILTNVADVSTVYHALTDALDAVLTTVAGYTVQETDELTTNQPYAFATYDNATKGLSIDIQARVYSGDDGESYMVILDIGTDNDSGDPDPSSGNDEDYTAVTEVIERQQGTYYGLSGTLVILANGTVTLDNNAYATMYTGTAGEYFFKFGSTYTPVTFYSVGSATRSVVVSSATFSKEVTDATYGALRPCFETDEIADTYDGDDGTLIISEYGSFSIVGTVSVSRAIWKSVSGNNFYVYNATANEYLPVVRDGTTLTYDGETFTVRGGGGNVEVPTGMAGYYECSDGTSFTISAEGLCSLSVNNAMRGPLDRDATSGVYFFTAGTRYDLTFGENYSSVTFTFGVETTYTRVTPWENCTNPPEALVGYYESGNNTIVISATGSVSINGVGSLATLKKREGGDDYGIEISGVVSAAVFGANYGTLNFDGKNYIHTTPWAAVTAPEASLVGYYENDYGYYVEIALDGTVVIGGGATEDDGVLHSRNETEFAIFVDGDYETITIGTSPATITLYSEVYTKTTRWAAVTENCAIAGYYESSEAYENIRTITINADGTATHVSGSTTTTYTVYSRNGDEYSLKEATYGGLTEITFTGTTFSFYSRDYVKTSPRVLMTDTSAFSGTYSLSDMAYITITTDGKLKSEDNTFDIYSQTIGESTTYSYLTETNNYVELNFNAVDVSVEFEYFAYTRISTSTFEPAVTTGMVGTYVDGSDYTITVNTDGTMTYDGGTYDIYTLDSDYYLHYGSSYVQFTYDGTAQTIELGSTTYTLE